MAVSQRLAARIRDTAHQRSVYYLPTGETINSYFDEFSLAADPELLRDVAAAMRRQLPCDIDAVVGVELGGIPLAVALSAASGLPAAFLRRQPKTYGSFRQVEGANVSGSHVALVDDVVRSGSQLLRAAELLRHHGARTCTGICVLDRGLSGSEQLGRNDIDLRTLLTDEIVGSDNPV